ncbi:MAG: aspartyl protease family protein [bacterium]|nr:aspartyl protease family protein [bacterium]
MGEVRCKVRLENFVDRYMFEEGKLPEKKIRKEVAIALVDTGATLLVLPQDLVEKLGLRKLKRVIVTYADERNEERDVAGVVTLTIDDRSANLDCVVGPPLCEPLIGQIALEEMDLVVDCKDQRLKPRPESPRLPLLKCK